MLTKIAVTALIILLAWLLLFRRPRPRGPAPGGDRRALPGPLHFARCPGCGTYRMARTPCRCGRDGAGE